MNSRMTPRGTYPGGPQPPFHPAPNAALLIDFDNVTMAIRGDLGKELKSLMNSDVIRGKVAVQRAYADWRRYPQYIVPLAESSVDLIFAPAYGSAKKNATDLRMAIDAIELVFTRPEIGTFILMTGDSDFSSCVLKLKEYGKYVIGVGMRESSSDLLIQNCDEYYSYHSLSGLTRAGEVQDSKEDPWVLVKRAIQQMVKNGDVMRTDRLKQVMLELDPAFDEKKIGYSKFSRFVSEAASKNLIRLRKTENGQYEIIPEGVTAPEQREPREKVVERIVAEAEIETRRRRGGRDDRDRRPREASAARSEEPVAPRVLESPAQAFEPSPEIAAQAAVEPAARVEEVAAAPPAVAASAPALPREEGAAEVAPSGALDAGYSLLQEAVRRIGGRDGRGIRDGDVKRKMLEIDRGFDETDLGFSKFTRFLRQAHDAEVIDLTRAGAGNYEVALPASGRKLPPPAESATVGAPDLREPSAEAAPRGRAGARPEPAREAPAARQPEQPTTRDVESAPAAPAVQAPAARAAEAPAAPSPAAAPPVGALRGRRGGRGPALGGPPPILPGQGVVSPLKASAPPPVVEQPTEVQPAAAAAQEQVEAVLPAAEAEAAAPEKKARRGGRGRVRKAAEPIEEPQLAETAPEAEAPVETAAVAPPVAEQAEAPEAAEPAEAPAATARSRRGRRSRGDRVGDQPPVLLEGQVATVPTAADVPAAEQAAAAAPDAEEAAEAATAEGAPAKRTRSRGGRGRKRGSAAPEAETAAFSAESLGLPREPGEIRNYLSSSYKGIGLKTADALLEEFGSGLFQVMQERPEEIRSKLQDRRADTLLDQWKADFERRTNGGGAASEQAAPEKAPEEAAAEQAAAEETPNRAPRPRRGGRGRGGKKEPAASG
jgi:uncharacterized protein (TIGR00288 family)